MIIILYTAKWPKANEWGNGKNQMNEGMVKNKWMREWPKQMNEGMTEAMSKRVDDMMWLLYFMELMRE